MVKPDGTLVLSVSNARRRFRAEQRTSARLVRAGTLEPGDILYKRGREDGATRMVYHLHTLAEVRGELSAAGRRPPICRNRVRLRR